MIKTNCRILIFLLLLIPTIAYSTDLQIGGVFETFTEKSNFGAEFEVSESISNNLSINAVLEYNYKNSYDAYCAGKFSLPNFYFLTGFVFDIRNSLLTPGLVFESRFDFVSLFSLSGKAIFTFSTDNIFENCINDCTLNMIFHCKNSDITLTYNYTHLLYNSKKDFSHKGYLDVLAFEKGFPFMVGVNFGSDFDLKEYNPDFLDVAVIAGAKFILDTGKAGLYTLKGDAEIFRLSGNPSIPFGITFSSKYFLN